MKGTKFTIGEFIEKEFLWPKCEELYKKLIKHLEKEEGNKIYFYEGDSNKDERNEFKSARKKLVFAVRYELRQTVKRNCPDEKTTCRLNYLACTCCDKYSKKLMKVLGVKPDQFDSLFGWTPGGPHEKIEGYKFIGEPI
jgi:hypothetical protein